MTESSNHDLITYRIQRAKETIKEAELLNKNKFWNAAINRIYYASFYAVQALLVKNNVESHTHSGVRQQFGFHFIKTGIIDKHLGKFYSDIFDKRHTGDYDDFIVFNQNEVLELLKTCIELVSKIETIILEK